MITLHIVAGFIFWPLMAVGYLLHLVADGIRAVGEWLHDSTLPR